ncbi:molybdenum cofactor cytidylyltransferase [Sedimentibacter acidaminivorans]|uniref:Molybdenum cofactor cytidylyltransferase n=1 Tax=Sedimentibacter acidaminivorans TaxID=913099 RepID=A0ABS4GEI3_9FIRM|nr:NTP transferase domain-containing protein [Sedimentibacter acidaminivorans]MBP1925770.1 molybdenum cofactor cytidylyltransferase [Sedimentibacter acidaminivorans]
MKISAIVMASGLSRRMNTNKLQMEINNKKIYEYILETIKSNEFHEVIVVTNDQNINSKAESLGYKTLSNPNAYLGQSVSIKIALENSSESSGYMFFVADQPFVSSNTINIICDIFKNNLDRIIIPSYNGINGNPVLFPCSLKNELMSISGDSGGKAVIKNNLDKVINVEIHNVNEHMDIDTLEDYEKVLKMKVIE